tara:strand:+ start:704 stop:811 length:108 start_codon:yes stop_codon:yes gene_type:complete
VLFLGFEEKVIKIVARIYPSTLIENAPNQNLDPYT